MTGLTATCTGRDYRGRTDLHATERALISSVAPLCGNSARGGYRHEPDLSVYGKVEFPAYDDPASPSTTASLEKLNADIETLLRDDKDYWEGERGVEPISKAASEGALTSARVTRLVAGGVSHLRVAKDVTEEAFRSDDGRLG